MSRIPQFDKVKLEPTAPSDGAAQWRQRLALESGRPFSEFGRRSLAGIDIQPLYTAEDLAGLEPKDLREELRKR